MSTNKRKESAALFELIDKSTLKVPKNAGSLKIPNWWSSKANPTTAEAKPAAPPTRVAVSTPTGEPAAIPPQSPGTASPATVSVHAPAAEAGAPTEEAPVQHRLFDPPPPNVAPQTSPSIRPPMGGAAPVHVAPAVKPAGKGMPLNSPPERDEKKPAGPPAPRVFAPQTYAQDRKAWSPPRPGALARLPMWAIISGVAGVVILVCVTVLIIQSLNKKPSGGNASAATTTSRGSNAATRTMILGPSVVQPGKVYEGGTVGHAPDRYYVIVLTTPSQSAAGESARFLAAHGVDCSIERIGTDNQLMYMLVSVQGFASNTTAKPYLKTILDIGNLMRPNGPNPWTGAYLRTGLSAPGTAPARSGTR